MLNNGTVVDIRDLFTNVSNITYIETLPFHKWRYCFISNGEGTACTPDYWVIGLGLLIVGISIFALIKSTKSLQ